MIGLALSATVAILVAAAPVGAPGAGGEAKTPAQAETLASASQAAARRADALFRAGRPQEAIALLRDAAAHDPQDATIQFTLASALIRIRDYDGAIAALRAGLALAPHNLIARKTLGSTQRKKGDLAAARATLEALWRDEPSFRPAGVELAEVMAEQGDRRAAIETYRYLIDTSGPAEDSRLAALYAGLARTLEAEGDRPGALAAYREALRIDPKQAQARSALKRLSR